MTQELINRYFQSPLGQQCNSLFSTPDDRVFIRYEEAKQHCIDNSLNRMKILEWFEEWSGTNADPIVRSIEEPEEYNGQDFMDYPQ